jgi:hypothetical protein
MLAAKGSLRHFIFNELRVNTDELLLSPDEWELLVSECHFAKNTPGPNRFTSPR